jgi:hypothetical protein
MGPTQTRKEIHFPWPSAVLADHGTLPTTAVKQAQLRGISHCETSGRQPDAREETVPVTELIARILLHAAQHDVGRAQQFDSTRR